jgi:hypothetical protein
LTSRHLGMRLIALGAAAALTGCSASETSSTPPHATAAFEHVHGLGVDPATGHTYAATHQGVWLIPTGDLPESYLADAPRPNVAELTQIGGRAQDTMGFTVAQPGLLLASGHPDPSDPSATGLPNLGLVSSVDGAKTWDSISLAGQTDFHDLAAVTLNTGALRVYGYDPGTGTVQISDDGGSTWRSGASAPIRDLAANTSDPDRVIATTADGLIESSDAGRTFREVPDAPVLLLIEILDESAGGGLVGTDPNGALWRQEETGSWTQTSKAEGAPEALTAVGGTSPWILVADQQGISATDDFGATWTPVLRDVVTP